MLDFVKFVCSELRHRRTVSVLAVLFAMNAIVSIASQPNVLIRFNG